MRVKRQSKTALQWIFSLIVLADFSARTHSPHSYFVGRRLNRLVHEEKDLKKALEIFQVEMKEECVHQELPHFRHRKSGSWPVDRLPS